MGSYLRGGPFAAEGRGFPSGLFPHLRGLPPQKIMKSPCLFWEAKLHGAALGKDPQGVRPKARREEKSL